MAINRNSPTFKIEVAQIRISGCAENKSVLRELFGAVWNGVKHRHRSADHERIRLNLAAFCLRPGYGYPLDDWRLQQLWSVHDQGVQHVHDERVSLEWWTMWRRVVAIRIALDSLMGNERLADLSPIALFGFCRDIIPTEDGFRRVPAVAAHPSGPLKIVCCVVLLEFQPVSIISTFTKEFTA